MALYRQRALDIINPKTEMHYAILSGYPNTTFPHSHDFFECSLQVKGNQVFKINDHKYKIKEGSLILIRPNDVHSRRYVTKGNHINIAFYSGIAKSLFDYLGEGYPTDKLLKSSTPPFVMLNRQELNHVRDRMRELYAISLTNATLQRTMLRTLIMDIFVNYFARCVAETSGEEDWFGNLLHEMERPAHLTEGLPALLRLSGYTHEHLCRVFKQRIQSTPTAYVNDLRLNFAANYLIHSDLDITDICFHSGFNSISHFYHLFNQKFSLSPRQFRLEETRRANDGKFYVSSTNNKGEKEAIIIDP